jgi:hypothetical protein
MVNYIRHRGYRRTHYFPPPLRLIPLGIHPFRAWLGPRSFLLTMSENQHYAKGIVPVLHVYLFFWHFSFLLKSHNFFDNNFADTDF